jgi:hypothetical protein
MVSRTAHVLQQISQRVVDDAQHDLVTERDQTLSDLERSIIQRRESVGPLLERYLLRHELPGSAWGLRWRVQPSAPQAVTSEASALAPCGLESSYRLEIPGSDRWAGPVGVGDLCPELEIELPRSSAFRRTVRFSQLLVTAVDLSSSAGRRTLKLHREDRLQEPGYELVQSRDELPVVHSLDRSGASAAEIHFAGTEAEEVQRLIEKVAQDLLPLVHCRVEMTAASLDERPLSELEDLSGLASALVGSLAPFVREIVLRSPNSDELCLKRGTGERQREELFVPTREITSMIQSLPEEQQVLFAPFSLAPASPSRDDTIRERVRIARPTPVLAIAS